MKTTTTHCVWEGEKMKLIDEKTRRKNGKRCARVLNLTPRSSSSSRTAAGTTRAEAMANWLTNWLTCRFIFCLFFFVALNLPSLPFQPSFLTLIWTVSSYSTNTPTPIVWHHHSNQTYSRLSPFCLLARLYVLAHKRRRRRRSWKLNLSLSFIRHHHHHHHLTGWHWHCRRHCQLQLALLDKQLI